ncbi:hypothetical protein BZA05DRAFT_466426 [Tricharina praecox]|uniref:uncharacterized protein n=1 Tax=Tricharina praecox TaxID=43433 RepID=UPI00222013A4|nr:uncharacterized protein BZA05DRAFT_466426 [Tricharina praecox]KAI5855509.1 hypothetical protein BZA05DRAFT_466426 [Tricharina praecox]
MAPSLSIFSRRKNSDGDRTATPKSPERSTPRSPAPSYSIPTVTTTRFRSRSNDSPGPASPKHLPRLQTSPTPQEPSSSLRRTPSSVSTSSHHGHQRSVSSSSNYVAFPPSPHPGRQIYQPAPQRTQRFQHYSHTSDNASVSMLPTPVETPVTPAVATPTSARPGENARKRAFRFPPSNNALPISPPLSPESPLVFGYSPMEAGNNSLGMSPIFPMRNHANTPSMDSTESQVGPTPYRSRHGAAAAVGGGVGAGGGADQWQSDSLLLLLNRIRELERELETETSHHSTRIAALRQSHVDVVAALKEGHAADRDALRKATAPGWSLLAIEGKEKELELLRSNNDMLNLRLEDMEELLQERDRQLEWLKDKLRDGAECVEVDKVLAEEQRQRLQLQKRSKEEIGLGMQGVEEEGGEGEVEKRRRCELAGKLSTVEARRNIERLEYESHLETMRRERETLEAKLRDANEELEKRRVVVPLTHLHRSGNDDLVAMVKTLNARLTEEKKKNQYLEATMAQITEDAWFTVSDSKHDIQKLKNAAEDRDAHIAGLNREFAIVKRERNEFEEAWKTLCKENAALQQATEDRSERIKDLEEESGALRDTLEHTRAQLASLQQQQQQQQTFEIPIKLATSSSSSSSSSRSISPPAASDSPATNLSDVVAQLKRDTKLYRNDIRAYKRDVKRRDATILQLQAQLCATPNLTLLSEFPVPPLPRLSDNTGTVQQQQQQQLKDENGALKAQLAERDGLARQQTLLLNDMEEKVKRLRREKELFEIETLQQFRRMQNSFVVLERRAMEVAEVNANGDAGNGNGNGALGGKGRVGLGVGVGLGVDADGDELPPLPPPPPPPPKSPGGPMTPGREEERGEVFVW